MPKNSLYDTLGVPPTATPEEIRSAYRTLLREYHPDVYRGPDPELAAHRSREINDAYEVLIDPVRRSNYDFDQASGALPSEPPRSSPIPSPAATRPPSRTVDEEDEDDAGGPSPGGALWVPAPGPVAPASPSALFPAYLWKNWPQAGKPKKRPPASPLKKFTILFVLLAVSAILLVALTLPYAQSQRVVLAPKYPGTPQDGEVCVATVTFPAGARIHVSWTSTGGDLFNDLPSPQNVTPVSDVTVDPESPPYVTNNQTAWNGSFSFVSQGGDYEVSIDPLCGVEYWYDAQILFQYTAPII